MGLAGPASAPEPVEAWYARVEAALDADGTLAASPPDSFARWDAFPFEIAEDARTRPVLPLTATDRARVGDDPAECPCVTWHAQDDPKLLWRNEHWRLQRVDRTGLPIIVILEPIAHLDLTSLPDDLAAEFGLLAVRLAAAIESLPSVGRCHVSRWGDGGAHGHVWFIGRPLRHPQVVGSVAVVWDDLLPALPDDVRDANHAHVVAELVRRHGGTPA